MAFGDIGKFDANQMNSNLRVTAPAWNGSNISASNGMTPVQYASPTRFLSSDTDTTLTLYKQDGTDFTQAVSARLLYPIGCYGIADSSDTATLTVYE